MVPEELPDFSMSQYILVFAERTGGNNWLTETAKPMIAAGKTSGISKDSISSTSRGGCQTGVMTDPCSGINLPEECGTDVSIEAMVDVMDSMLMLSTSNLP